MATTDYQSKLEELRKALKRVKEGIKFSMIAGTWNREVDASKHIRSLFDKDELLTQR